MIYETEKYVDILVKLGITPNQFFICWVLYNRQYELLAKYIEMNGVFKKEDIDGLVNKDLILLTKAGSYDIGEMVVTQEFAEEMIIEPEEAWEQFFNTYPNMLVVNNIKYAAKGLSISDELACVTKYTELLKKNKYLHIRIVNAVEKWKKDNNGYATMKIDKFLTSKHWEELEKSENTNAKPRLY